MTEVQLCKCKCDEQACCCTPSITKTVEPVSKPPKLDLTFHCIEVLDIKYIIPSHYQITKMIGRGSYGVVCSGLNTKTESRVAIKKILKVVSELTETKRLLREIKLLRFFDHDNIIRITDLLNPVRLNSLEDLYIVTELMDSDL